MRVQVALAVVFAALAAAARAEDPPVAPPKTPDPKIERRLPAPADRIAVSPDGKWIAASDNRGALVLFAAESDEKRSLVPEGPARTADGPRPTTFEQLVFTDDGSVLVAVPVSADDGAQIVHFMGVADGKELRTLDTSVKRDPQTRRVGEGDCLLQVGAEPGGSKVRFLRQSSVEIWDTASGEKVESRKNEPYAQQSVRTADGALTAYGVTSEFRVVDTASGKERWKFNHSHVAMSGKKVDTMTSATCKELGFTTDAKLLLVYADIEETRDPGSLNANNLDSRTKKTRRIEGYSTADGKLVWHHDLSQDAYPWQPCIGADIVAVVDDGKLVFLNAASGQTKDTAPASAKYECVAASRDGLTFWAGTDDGRVVKVKTFPAPKGK
jgi:outer membrane protein assembly factor BamB